MRGVAPGTAPGSPCGGPALITLVPLDEPALARLLDAAVAGADPLEVMPPVTGPPGWTAARRAAFLAFHRGRSLDPSTAVERTWVVDVDSAAVGAARLERHGDAVEAGLWLSRAARGRGVGREVTRLLLAEARTSDAARFIASTTPDNHGARSLLAGLGAVLTTEGDEVAAVLRLRP
ncbi:Protein N-acetyltransferase, RimJ/RimL family [Amycolatopsis pretoriensis]|uniref:Protein N-acetyltransferase, RimJ/RimL family n=1 Tax=Amycolatopsis pretoriensis TaxID=218821 RepID=A0A1H5RB79_9PSEU|nr:GNAT family N-acetyltransferase [Amycolatopsis pretoriensis]SEF35650.1 Protein N-acetyltransferase, RimJ/RimL family [Amycolatopsis pretoriensis]